MTIRQDDVAGTGPDAVFGFFANPVERLSEPVLFAKIETAVDDRDATAERRDYRLERGVRNKGALEREDAGLSPVASRTLHRFSKRVFRLMSRFSRRLSIGGIGDLAEILAQEMAERTVLV